MKQLLFGLLLFFPFALTAQVIPRLDSLNNSLNSTLDSLNKVEKNLEPGNKLDSARHSFQVKVDTLLNPVSAPLDSLNQSIKAKKDDLYALKPHQKFSHKLDSLQELTALPENKLSEWEAKQNKTINSGIDKVGDKAQDNTEFVNRIPGAELSNEQLGNFPDLQSTKMGEFPKPPGSSEADQVKDLGSGLNDEKPDNSQISNPMKSDGKSNKIADKIKETKELSNGKIGQLKEDSGMEKVAEEFQEFKGYSQELEGYQEDIEKAKEGDLERVEKRVENKVVENFDEIGEVKGQSEGIRQELAGQAQQLEQVEQEAYVKQQLQEKAMEVVNAQFSSENLEKVQLAKQKLNKYKSKYSSWQYISDSLRVKRNSLKDKPFIERVSPGFVFEILRGDQLYLDLAPSIGYKFTQRISLHGAYMYRFVFDTEDTKFEWGQPTYGPRFFAVYEVNKGFQGIVGYEQLRTNVPRNQAIAETSRKWVRGGFVGIGKAYSISKKVKGNLQVLYNFLYDHKTPYPMRYNVRMGFDFSFKKKLKK